MFESWNFPDFMAYFLKVWLYVMEVKLQGFNDCVQPYQVKYSIHFHNNLCLATIFQPHQLLKKK